MEAILLIISGQLLESLENSLQQKSGGDCHEYSYEAVEAALDHRSVHPLLPFLHDLTLRTGSQIIVLTDAPPKGDTSARDNLRETIISKARNSDMCIHFFLPSDTFNCLEDFPDGLEEYKSIANSTRGFLIDSGFEFSMFASSYSDHPCQTMKHTVERQKRDVANWQRKLPCLLCLQSFPASPSDNSSQPEKYCCQFSQKK